MTTMTLSTTGWRRANRALELYNLASAHAKAGRWTMAWLVSNQARATAKASEQAYAAAEAVLS